MKKRHNTEWFYTIFKYLLYDHNLFYIRTQNNENKVIFHNDIPLINMVPVTFKSDAHNHKFLIDRIIDADISHTNWIERYWFSMWLLSYHISYHIIRFTLRCNDQVVNKMKIRLLKVKTSIISMSYITSSQLIKM